MSYSNGLLSDQSHQTANKYVQRGLPGVGFKLTDTGDYDMQNKKLVNVDEGDNNQDVVNKHQLDVGLQTKPNKTDVLLLDGTTHMVGDLDLRGNKIILPGEIQMDRKLITNLNTDENQDLSAVNMITLKNKVEPKADKDYVDFEITKQNALINNTFVKKTGDQMTGDLILQPQPYPVQGNTDKAVSYNTTRSIFLSRKEGGAMETDINMNNNFIQNVMMPTSSHQATNKGYCDYNFLNRRKGGVIMGPLSMNRNDLIGIPDTPKFGYSAVNKNYVDGEISKIDTTQLVKKAGDTMSGVLNMNGNKIKNVGTPDTHENDAVVNVSFFNTELNDSNSNLSTQITNAYKQYVDHSHVSPSGLQRDAFRYLMEDTDDSSTENNIRVTGIVDFVASPHQINKKAYEFTLVKDTDGSNDYRSRIGFNLFKLPLGYYTLVVEYFPPEMNNVIVTAQGTTISIASQTTKTFGNYTKTLVKFHNFTKTTPDFIFINLHGKTISSTSGHLIVYGVEGYVSSVEPKVYDTAFVVENGKMTMETDIDLNGHSINTPFFITGYYKKSKSSNRIFLNDVSTYQIIPFDCVLKEIVCYFYTLNNNDYQITLNVRSSGKSRNNQILNSSLNDRRQVFSSGINLSKNDVLWIDINKKNTDEVITHDEAVFAFSFTPR